MAAIVGILFATLHPSTPAPAPVGPVAQATPSAAPTSPAPTSAPTQAPTATPAPSATSSPNPATAGTIIDEKYLSSVVPDGFTVKDHTVVSIHLTSGDGDVYIDTGTFDPSDPGSTLPGLVNEEIVADQKYSSDVKICVPAKANQGNFGQSTVAYETVTLCGNWTPTQGQAFPFDDGYAHALGMYHGKPFVMRVDFFAVANKSAAFFASPAAHQILAGVVFKLYGAP